VLSGNGWACGDDVQASDLDMSQKEVYQFNVPTFGKGVVFDVDHTVRLEQFRFFAEALKTNRMRTYVGMMVQEAEVRIFASPYPLASQRCAKYAWPTRGAVGTL
jgi:hypothetical protein